jgi:16S rRNA (cytosine967-C5)-methyltransferase
VTVTAREVALDALVRVDEGAFSHVVLPELLRRTSLDPRDRAWVTDAVYGTLRLRRRLDARLASLTHRPLPRLDPPVRAALRLGAWQLTEAGTPAHAAVGETVAALRARPAARGFVNAVLRRLAEAPPSVGSEALDPVARLALDTSHPDWIARDLVAEFGAERAAAVLEADNVPPAVTLRVNPERATVAEVAAALRATDADVAPGPLGGGALVVRGAGDLAAAGPVRDGWATPQDEASQAVVALLAPPPGARVLDVAAGPGGKATAAGERVGPDGFVLACDLHPGRAVLVRTAARRLGLGGRVGVVVADGRCVPARRERFERVLVDAPCSGLGVLRRRAEARWRADPGEVPRLAGLQRELLAAAAPLVAPGGRLVYSVCTWTRAETVDAASWAAEALAGFRAVPPPPPWQPHGLGGLLLPDQGTDGMFALVLDRV